MRLYSLNPPYKLSL